VKLHTKLGKPIPPPDPKAAAAIAALNAQEEAAKVKPNDVPNPVAPAGVNLPTVRSAPPRINFVAGTSNKWTIDTLVRDGTHSLHLDIFLFSWNWFKCCHKYD